MQTSSIKQHNTYNDIHVPFSPFFSQIVIETGFTALEITEYLLLNANKMDITEIKCRQVVSSAIIVFSLFLSDCYRDWLHSP